MRKTMRKSALLSSVAMLIVSAIVLTSATYAWFSTAKVVTVDEISIGVNTATGLVVSVDKGTNWLNEVNFDNAVAVSEGVGAGIPEQFVPVSSSNGADWIKGEYDLDNNKLALTDATPGKEGQYVAVPFWVYGPETGRKVNVDISFAGSTEETSLKCVRFALIKENGGTLSNGKVVADKAGTYQGTSDKNAKADTDKASYAADGTSITTIAQGDNCFQLTLGDAAKVTAENPYSTENADKYIALIWLEGNDEDCVLKNFRDAKTNNVKFNMTLTLQDPTPPAEG